MIIGKFKSNHPLMFAMLLMAALIMWTDGFIFHQQIRLPDSGSAPFYGIIADFFNENTLLSVVLSFLMLILQAFMFNRVLADKNIVDRNSWLPALVYIVFMSSGFGMFGLQPIWFANFFLILALDKMFNVFKDESGNIEIFNIGLFVSIASLFYLPALLFIFLVFTALVIYFFINLKEFFASLTGLIIPWLFVALYYYWNDTLIDKIDELQKITINADIFDLGITPFGWVSIIVTGIITSISLLRLYFGVVRDKPIRIRKRFQVLLAYFIIALLSFIFTEKYINIHYGLLLVPLSAIIAAFFQENKQKLFNEILFTVILLMALIGKISRLE